MSRFGLNIHLLLPLIGEFFTSVSIVTFDAVHLFVEADGLLWPIPEH